MKRTLLATLALTLALGSTAYADQQGGPVKIMGEGTDAYFVTHEGLTLYTFDNDTAGVSNCNGGCAAAWPPLTTDAGTALPDGFSLIARADGAMQVAHEGQPLYGWASDSQPGDMTGDGVNDVWHTARP